MSKRISILCIIILILGAFSLFIGVKDITPLSLFKMEPEKLEVFFISRVPRLMAILCTGMALSVAGVIMQSVMSNNFVSPSTGSTMDWARLGVLISILFFPSASVGTKMLLASSFAFVGSMLFIRLLRAIKLKDPIFTPLVGIMLGNVVMSVTTYIAYQHNLIQNISSWLQGSFTMIIMGRYELLYIGIPLLIIAYIYATRFTIASMGSDFSNNLGISHSTTVTIGILISSLITSVVVTVGIIPFIGLIVPNIVRMYSGDNLKSNIWEISLVGALFVLVCDMISRLLIYPFEIPISVIAGIIGSVFFLYFLLGGKKRHAKKSS